MCKTCNCPADGKQQFEVETEGVMDETSLEKVKLTLLRLPGIYHVELNAKQRVWIVDVDARRTSEAEIRQEIEGSGHRVLRMAPVHHHHHHHG